MSSPEKYLAAVRTQGIPLYSKMYIINPKDDPNLYIMHLDGNNTMDYPSSPEFWDRHINHVAKPNWVLLEQYPEGIWGMRQLMFNENPQDRQIIINALKNHVPSMSEAAYQRIIDPMMGLGRDLTQELQQTRNAASQAPPNQALTNITINNGQPAPPPQSAPIPSPPPQEKSAVDDLMKQTQQEGKEQLATDLEEKGMDPSTAKKTANAIENSSAYKELMRKEENLYYGLLKQLRDLEMNGFDNVESWQKAQALRKLINERAAQQIWNAADFGSVPTNIKHYLYETFPEIEKGKIPKIGDFGKMNRRQGLNYIVSSSAAFDAMQQLLYSGKKVTFNPNLLTVTGATRYAKSIGGTLAPIADYDKDGMPDFYIYNKSGKIVVINGMRLKDDHKMKLKRIFYQQYPDRAERKRMGGFRGWLSTVLFQVGPYNFQGVRKVNIPTKSYELLKMLKEKGYLDKDPEKYFPKTKKSLAATIKGHIMDAIKQGINQAFSEYTKMAWYLPQNAIRDFIYNITILPLVQKYAKEHNDYNRLEALLAGYAVRTGKKNISMKKKFTVLGQYLSKNEDCQNKIYAMLSQLLTELYSKCNYYALQIICYATSFHTFVKNNPNTDAFFNSQTESQLYQVKSMLNQMKGQWGVQVRKAFKPVYDQFDGITYESLKELFEKAKHACTQYGLENLTDVQFIIEPKLISMQGPPNYNSYDKKPNDIGYYQSFSDNDYKKYNYNPDLTQKPWQNYFSDAFTNVTGGKNKFQYLNDAGTFNDAYMKGANAASNGFYQIKN